MKRDILIIGECIENYIKIYDFLCDHEISILQIENIEAKKVGLALHSPTFLLLDYDIKRTFSRLKEFMNENWALQPYVIAIGTFSDTASRITALQLGADTCIRKPIDAHEILAVMDAVQRREQHLGRFDCSGQFAPITYKKLTIDPFRRQVVMRGKTVDLTTREFDILYLLAKRKGTALSKKEIYQSVWNTAFDLDVSVVADHISSIRKKLGIKARDSGYIRTVFGVGYSLGWMNIEH